MIDYIDYFEFIGVVILPDAYHVKTDKFSIEDFFDVETLSESEFGEDIYRTEHLSLVPNSARFGVGCFNGWGRPYERPTDWQDDDTILWFDEILCYHVKLINDALMPYLKTTFNLNINSRIRVWVGEYEPTLKELSIQEMRHTFANRRLIPIVGKYLKVSPQQKYYAGDIPTLVNSLALNEPQTMRRSRAMSDTIKLNQSGDNGDWIQEDHVCTDSDCYRTVTIQYPCTLKELKYQAVHWEISQSDNEYEQDWLGTGNIQLSFSYIIDQEGN